MNSINQIGLFDYNKNQKSNFNLHFDGNGRIVHKTMHNIDDVFRLKNPDTAIKFIQALKARKNKYYLIAKLEKFFNGDLDLNTVNLLEKDIKNSLLKEKIIDKIGNINILNPVKLEIKRGTGWIPDNIEADYIIMKGGKVKTLTGKKVKVFKDAKVRGSINADEIIVYGGRFNTLSGISIKVFDAKKILKAFAKKALYVENSNVEKAYIEGIASVTTKVNKNNIKSKVNYIEASNLSVTGPSEILHSNVTNKTETWGEVSIIKFIKELFLLVTKP